MNIYIYIGDDETSLKRASEKVERGEDSQKKVCSLIKTS